ncbi:MAG TPA: TonB-dependent receptor, partial [Gammaproteobacteria bacterium]|nr:TonB-dependent receptor [Gammaproteobacteria bacterium]
MTRFFNSAVFFTSIFIAQQTHAETLTSDSLVQNTDIPATNNTGTVHDPLIVTATRTPVTVSQTLAPVTLITREDIEKSQALSLQELLQNLPGIDLTTQGGLGKLASLYLRGTATGHTLFMIDGVRIGSATLGTTAIENIPLEQIDHIEIVRGPRSGLYGSEAIGGVIQIFTRKGDDSTRINARAGYGTYNTREADAGISGNSSLGHYTLHAASTQTDGINSLNNNNPDKDGYKNRSLTAGFNRALGDISDISVNFFHTDATTHYDDSYSAIPTDIDWADSAQNILSSEVKLYLADELDNVIRLSSQRDENSAFKNSLDNGQFDTLRKQLTWQGDYHLNSDNTFTLGYDRLAEEIDTSTSYTVSDRDNRAVFGQIQTGFAQQNIVMALRSDNNEAFGHHQTGNIDWRWNFSGNASMTASYGRAFKSPTFNDLYSPYGGNPGLLPEESRSVEIMTRINNNDTQFSLNIYRTQIDNLIEWTPVDPNDPYSSWSPANVSAVTLEGMETEIATKLSSWTVRGNINLTNPRDNVSGNVLQRRVRQSARIDLDRDYENASAGISLQAFGSRFSDADNLVTLPGFSLVNLRSRYDFSKSLSLNGKIDNLLDKEY